MDVERLAKALGASLIYFDPKVSLAEAAKRIADEYEQLDDSPDPSWTADGYVVAPLDWKGELGAD